MKGILKNPGQHMVKTMSKNCSQPKIMENNQMLNAMTAENGEKSN